MNIIAIDTSSSYGSVAIAVNNKISFINYLDIPITHSERLMLQIDRGLQECKLTLNDINLIALTIGPGSFTGIRIGLATVKGFCSALNIPLYPVNTLKVLAYNLYGVECNVFPIIDAKMNEIYTALYDHNFNTIIEPVCVRPEEFITNITQPAIAVGDGVLKYKNLLHRDIRISLPHQSCVLASTLLSMAITEAQEATFDFDIIAKLEPLYLRKSQAELKKENG